MLRRIDCLPLIDADSRAALWVLVTIYHGLLSQDFEGAWRRIYQTDQRFDAGEVDDSHAGRCDDAAQSGGVVNREDTDVIVVGRVRRAFTSRGFGVIQRRREAMSNW